MSERKITLTLKGGEGFDSPWIVFGGDTIQEIEYDLDQFRASQLMAKAVHMAAEFKAAHIEKRRASGQQATTPPPAEVPKQPVQAQQTNPGNVWGGGPVQQQAQVAQVAQQGQKPPPVCRCGQEMLLKQAGSSQAYRCQQWRYNGGNSSTDHDQIWYDKWHN